MKIISGGRYGRLTAIARAGSDGIQNEVWLCRCECGREHLVAARSLLTGNTLSCGCLHGTPRDRTGRRDNMLVALRPSCRRCKSGNLYWWYMCDCGNEVERLPGNIERGTTRSCGCYRRRVVYRQEG